MSRRRKGQIDLRVDDPQQLLDMLDPFPFRERGLDSEVDEYICEHAAEVPPELALAITIHLPPAQWQGILAQSLPGVVRQHFHQQAKRRGNELSRLFAQGRKALLIGLIVLGLCLLVGQSLVNLFPESRLAGVVMEGLVILGWVANWRPMEIFLFDWWPLVQERRLYRRLAQANVAVVAREDA
ncbi:hypothetical protein [Ancylobacter rudongensis]|uniref:Uncharacterized protein n=1 Tax=Ancylobacter rudongensis TaxID=177413 RepID=A0A1G4T9Y4_9HYPH|nr:hypothetical protein [Ancylobacter rudongensis]SCW78240.1 hypothetical protein SAMN05660859_2768 [Ancylobacter rudongensis]